MGLFPIKTKTKNVLYKYRGGYMAKISDRCLVQFGLLEKKRIEEDR